MNRLQRLIALLTIAGVAGAPLVAQPGDSAGNSEPLPADLQKLLEAVQPTWTASASLDATGGYKDNVLLSSTDPFSSGFARTGLEALLWHLPKGKVDYFAFLNGQYTRYFQHTADQLGRPVDHEAQAFAGVEWRWRQPDRLGIALDAQVYYLDQVFDVSLVPTLRTYAALKMTGAKTGPTVRWTLFHHVWIEGNPMIERQKFQDHLNDARIRQLSGRVGWTPNDRFEISIGASEQRRDFDRRPVATEEGIKPTLLLRVKEREADGRVVATWGASRHWRTNSRGGIREYRDNAEGFLNYRDAFGRQEIEWSAGKWLIRVEAEVRRRKYAHQFAEGGISPPPVVKNDSALLLRVERQVSAHWTLLAQVDEERSRSNDAIASYRMKEGLLGARWSWEK